MSDQDEQRSIFSQFSLLSSGRSAFEELPAHKLPGSKHRVISPRTVILVLTVFATGCGPLEAPVQSVPTPNVQLPTGMPQVEGPQLSPESVETPVETTSAAQGNRTTPEDAVTLTFGLTKFPHDPTSGEPGLVWAYHFPVGAGDIFVSADGSISAFSLQSEISAASVYTLSQADNLIRLNSEGSLIGVSTLDMEKPLMVIEGFMDLFTFSIQNPVQPVVLPDGTVIVISADSTVNALAPTGQLLWEFTLDAPPKTTPLLSGAVYYVIDESANLYAFDANGLVWRFQSAAASYAANGLAAGPEGRIYYTVTNFSRAYLQAVSPQGEDLWAVELQTEFFYDPLTVSQDGQLVAIRDDLIDTASGQRVELNPPVEVDEYYLGYDGLTYLRSGQSIRQLDRISGGFETTQMVDWTSAGAGRIPPRTVVIDENHVIWLFFWGNSDASNQLVWLPPDGNVLGDLALPEFPSGFILQPDYRNSKVMACRSEQDFHLLECALHSPFVSEPLWEMRFEGQGGLYAGSVIAENYLYFLTWDSTLHKLYMGESASQGP
jgi:outer membrane protein assembly factor BamB